MALTPEQLAELQRLKQMYLPLVEVQRRKDMDQANRERAGLPVTLPTDKKANGGSDRKSTRLNSSHSQQSRMPSSA